MTQTNTAVARNQDLIEHLTRQTTLSAATAVNVIEEVLAYYGEPVESFVRRRHLELRQQGHSNSLIYTTIKQEITERLFSADPQSERQIRRLIYG